MTEYSGIKSLDAEVTLDFIKKNIIMDYSLNKFGSPYESNSSTVLNNTFKKISFIEKCKEVFMFGCTGIALLPIACFSPIHTFCTEHQLITNPKIHYGYQQLLKHICIRGRGMVEQCKSGELFEPIITFSIHNNVWFEYELGGEYSNKIKSVALKRRFLKIYRFGKYPYQQQSGWNVIFEFTEIPKSGSCILRST